MGANVKKIAAVFAGQGAQYPGMGKSLYESSPAARAVFKAAGEKVTKDCFEATQDELNQTDVTQPAVYTVDLAAWYAFHEILGKGNIEVVGMAGFSLGEYAAFTAAGVIPDIASGIELIKKRGAFMAEAGRHADGSARGAMAAVLGAPGDILALVEVSRGKRGEYVLEAVNYNAPTQTVIAGDAGAIEIFANKAKESGKKLRVMPLPVSTAFHSPIMEPAAERIREAAVGINFGIPKHTLYLNMTGGGLPDFIAGGDAKGINLKGSLARADMSLLIPDIMARQVKSPVLWQRIIENIAASGAKLIIEFGPGKTLTGLAKKSAPGVSAVNVQDAESLEAAVRALREI